MVDTLIEEISIYRDMAKMHERLASQMEKRAETEERKLAELCADIRCEECPRNGCEPHSTRVCEFFAAKSDRLLELYADKGEQP